MTNQGRQPKFDAMTCADESGPETRIGSVVRHSDKMELVSFFSFVVFLLCFVAVAALLVQRKLRPDWVETATHIHTMRALLTVGVFCGLIVMYFVQIDAWITGEISYTETHRGLQYVRYVSVTVRRIDEPGRFFWHFFARTTYWFFGFVALLMSAVFLEWFYSSPTFP